MIRPNIKLVKRKEKIQARGGGGPLRGQGHTRSNGHQLGSIGESGGVGVGGERPSSLPPCLINTPLTPKPPINVYPTDAEGFKNGFLRGFS